MTKIHIRSKQTDFADATWKQSMLEKKTSDVEGAVYPRQFSFDKLERPKLYRLYKLLVSEYD